MFTHLVQKARTRKRDFSSLNRLFLAVTESVAMNSVRAAIVTIIGFLCVPVSNATPFDWAINEDYKQLDARGATDFQILFQGNVGGQITGGGMSSTTNPFANPTRTTSTDAFGNTIVRFAGSNTIPMDTTTGRHVGIFGTGQKPRVRFKAWSYATQPALVPVPKSNLAFLYDPAASTLSITIENTSPDTVTFQDVGFLLSSVEVPIDDLNRNVLPPSAFTSLPSLNHQYAPGDFDSELISGVDPSAFALTYGTVFFSGPSAGNPYNTTGGEWAEVAVATQVVPEPSTVFLLLVGLACFAAFRCRLPLFSRIGSCTRLFRFTGHALCDKRTSPHRRVLHLLSLLAALFMMTIGFVRAASGNAFVLPLVAPATDDVPTVQMGATVGGTPVTLTGVIIDTGADPALYIYSDAATALGIPAGAGAAGGAAGVGGRNTVRTGVTTPAGLGFTGPSTPLTPMGQPTTAPTLPGTLIVGPPPPGAPERGLIGSAFLRDFNYGRIRGTNGAFFYLAATDQMAAGVADAVAIASFLAFATPVQTNPDGRPAGNNSRRVFEIPSRTLPTGEQAQDGGFTMPSTISVLGGPVLPDVPFIIKSGLPTSLISSSLATSLGLDLAILPTVQVLGDFGPISVLQADLQVRLFDDPTFPVFTVPVGITDPSMNPFGDNFLAGDILGQLPYWEISEDATGVSQFFAATQVSPVPEPSTFTLLGIGALGLIGYIWQRRKQLA